MFEQRQMRTVRGGDPYAMVAPVLGALYNIGGIATQQAGPNVWTGKSIETGYGYVIKATVVTSPSPYGATIDLKLEAELEDKGIVLLYVSWVLCLPIAAVVFFLAWQSCRSAQSAIYAAAWSGSDPLLLPGG